MKQETKIIHFIAGIRIHFIQGNMNHIIRFYRILHEHNIIKYNTN